MPINLSEDFAIESNVYANQGNSDIGIRGSGKTHTATKTAEGLMTDGIPIVVFDPSGVWHNLRYGKDDQPGFPVVVAGGASPDLELTELNAVKILEAAMKENVSIIFDLSKLSSKKKEVKIVADCVEYMMDNNKSLRHVFIEEAAEFCPQRLYPSLARVFGELERMARLGRNQGLGFTLINQRSQEIAKSIFELCDRVFVHRQAGKNSLKAIDDWFKHMGVEDKNTIIKSIPKLVPGQCWVVDINGEHLIQVAPKQTFHPNPQTGMMHAPDSSKPDVSGFIKKMIDFIRSMEEEKPMDEKKPVDDQQLEKLKKANLDLLDTIDVLKLKLHKTNVRACELEERLSKIFKLADQGEEYTSDYSITMPEQPIKIHIPVDPIREVKITELKAPTNFDPSLALKSDIPPGALRMLKIAASFYPKPISRKLVLLHAGISPKSSNVANFIKVLKDEVLITTDSGSIQVTPVGKAYVGDAEQIPVGKDAVNYWCNFIGVGKATSNIFKYLAENYPDSKGKADIINAVGITEKSSSFNSAISELKGYHLVTGSNGTYMASSELFG